ncbi:MULTISPECIES: hypothetical protein [Sulfitobacter]|uniref:Uncharacterized protein n=1 Tax=Sulfitobacter faviae TaxID=1775881 RepID=A0ABZ0V198_9RHOB|nr:hypothetical protein [Sulfitobacter faviae]WPZ21671.1 hypothetical protein T7987_00040 [Sulfitobacter faviae]
MNDLEVIRFRLSHFAESAGDTAPSKILSSDGGPSREIMDYCDKHRLTLDWALLGSGPIHRKAKAPLLADIEFDAIFLHGLLQGLELLIDESESNSSPASNAAHALAQEVIAKSERLACDLSSLVDATPNARKAQLEAVK